MTTSPATTLGGEFAKLYPVKPDDLLKTLIVRLRQSDPAWNDHYRAFRALTCQGRSTKYVTVRDVQRSLDSEIANIRHVGPIKLALIRSIIPMDASEDDAVSMVDTESLVDLVPLPPVIEDCDGYQEAVEHYCQRLEELHDEIATIKRIANRWGKTSLTDGVRDLEREQNNLLARLGEIVYFNQREYRREHERNQATSTSPES